MKLIITFFYRGLIFFGVLFYSSFIFAQHTHDFSCGIEEITTPPPFNPLNSPYSGSVDPEYLNSFEPISFNIFFWGINKSDGTNDNYVTYDSILENIKRINEYFNPMGICFILKGYDYINNNTLYENASFGTIISYAQNNNHIIPNCFNVYIPRSLSAGNGVTTYGNNKLAINQAHFIGFWDLVPGNVLAHELAHDFGLTHPWGHANGTIITQEHVTRDINDPNYNALTHGDYIHDTPAMVSFWNEAIASDVTIYDIINPDDCSYLGNGTDLLGVPFSLTPTDVGNTMGYTLSFCEIGFTIGQGIRIREYIDNNPNSLSVQAMRDDYPSLDLYIKDSPEDFGEEPNNVTEYLWNSSDIWVRNQQDNIAEHQNPEYHPTNASYVYVRVTNRGCGTSTGNEQVKLYWAKAATSLDWDSHWTGGYFPDNGPLLGNEIGTINIPILQSGEQTIIEFPWTDIPNPTEYSDINNEPWHFCLLARIVSDDDPMTFAETSSLSANVRNNNNIAWKNLTVVDLEPNTIGKPIGGVIAVGNPLNELSSFDLVFVADSKETGKKIFEEAEVNITLDPIIFEAWQRGGKKGNHIKILKDEKNIIITGDNASLENLIFETKEIGTLNLTFHFLTKKITEKEEFTYHVVQKHNGTNDIFGGETYLIKKHPRGLFYADAGEDKDVDKNEIITLNAELINEPAVYNWYDNDGNLIYEGADFTVSVEIGKKYKLEVIALSDGYKDYTEIEVKLKPNSITTLYPNPTSNQITVAYKINEGSSAYLSVNSLYSSHTISYNYVLDIEEAEINIDVSSYPQGLYSITLITNGQISDTTTLIKQ